MSPRSATLDRRPPAPIDPRIRARRISVRRDEGRRRLRFALIALAVVGVLAAALLSLRSPLFDVDRIVVTGAEHTGAPAVLATAGIAKHRPLLDVDTGAARQRLEALPWVAAAHVTKSWPGTVRVQITERTPLAVVPAGQGGFAVVDAAGRVIEVDPAPPPGFVTLAGLAPAGVPGSVLDPAAADLLSVAAAIPAPAAPRIASVAAAPEGVELHLAESGVVRLGPASDVGEKLLALLTLFDQVDLAHVCTIDLRVPSAPSLTRGTPCA